MLRCYKEPSRVLSDASRVHVSVILLIRMARHHGRSQYHIDDDGSPQQSSLMWIPPPIQAFSFATIKLGSTQPDPAAAAEASQGDTEIWGKLIWPVIEISHPSMQGCKTPRFSRFVRRVEVKAAVPKMNAPGAVL